MSTHRYAAEVIDPRREVYYASTAATAPMGPGVPSSLLPLKGWMPGSLREQASRRSRPGVMKQVARRVVVVGRVVVYDLPRN